MFSFPFSFLRSTWAPHLIFVVHFSYGLLCRLKSLRWNYCFTFGNSSIMYFRILLLCLCSDWYWACSHWLRKLHPITINEWTFQIITRIHTDNGMQIAVRKSDLYMHTIHLGYNIKRTVCNSLSPCLKIYANNFTLIFNLILLICKLSESFLLARFLDTISSTHGYSSFFSTSHIPLRFGNMTCKP